MVKDIQTRTFQFALRIATLGRDDEYRRIVRQTVIRQLVRAATSIGANVEEAAAGQTKPDFVAKMAVARKESREVNFWLRLAEELRIVDDVDWPDLRREAMEVSRVVAASPATRSAHRTGNIVPELSAVPVGPHAWLPRSPYRGGVGAYTGAHGDKCVCRAAARLR
jgi:four helix bundle protein